MLSPLGVLRPVHLGPGSAPFLSELVSVVDPDIRGMPRRLLYASGRMPEVDLDLIARVAKPSRS